MRRTGDIGLISGVSDSGVAAGVRRIEALTGSRRRKAAQHANPARQSRGGASLKSPLEEMPARLGALLDERKKLERDLADARKKLAMGGGAQAAGGDDGVRSVGDIKLLARAVSGIDIKDLKSLADEGKKQIGSGVVAIVGVTDEGKAGVVVGVTADLTVALQRRRSRAQGRRGAGRQGRRRPARHGAGRRSGRLARPMRRSKAIEAALGGVALSREAAQRRR